VSEDITFPANNIVFKKQPTLPGRSAAYKMLVNGVELGEVKAWRDKTQEKVFGKHPMRYRIVGDVEPDWSSPIVAEVVTRMYRLKRDERFPLLEGGGKEREGNETSEETIAASE
jgi:hypothetical protein